MRREEIEVLAGRRVDVDPAGLAVDVVVVANARAEHARDARDARAADDEQRAAAVAVARRARVARGREHLLEPLEERLGVRIDSVHDELFAWSAALVVLTVRLAVSHREVARLERRVRRERERLDRRDGLRELAVREVVDRARVRVFVVRVGRARLDCRPRFAVRLKDSSPEHERGRALAADAVRRGHDVGLFDERGRAHRQVIAAKREVTDRGAHAADGAAVHDRLIAGLRVIGRRAATARGAHGGREEEEGCREAPHCSPE